MFHFQGDSEVVDLVSSFVISLAIINQKVQEHLFQEYHLLYLSPKCNSNNVLCLYKDLKSAYFCSLHTCILLAIHAMV